MKTGPRPFERIPLPDDLTAAVAVAIWKEAHAAAPEATADCLYHPGELHGVAPQLTGHLGVPMLRRARRRHGALNLA